MAVTATLGARTRAETGKSNNRKLRASGRIPAVLYGHGEETRPVSIDAHELELLFSRIHVESTLIDVAIEGDRAPVKALVREVQRHAVRDAVTHVDFYIIHAGETLTVDVPLRIQGTAPGVRIGGLLQQTLDTVEVRCLPDQIPEQIDVDISVLEIGDSIHVRDLAVPEGVEVLVDGDRTVCSVVPPTVTAETAAVEAATGEPEVIGRAKEPGAE